VVALAIACAACVESGGRLRLELEARIDDALATDVAAARRATDWRPVTDRVPNFGYGDQTVWLRASVDNPTGVRVERLLEVAYPNLDELELLAFEGEQLRAHFVTGDARPFSQRPIEHRNFVVPLTLPPGARLDVVLRVRSTTSLQAPVTLWEPVAFRAADQRASLSQGVYYGVMLVMALYNLFIFVSIRERAYLYYVAFVSSFASYQAFHHGFTYQHLWSNSPWWHDKSGALAISATLCFGALFAASFLDLSRRRQSLARALWTVAALAALNGAVAFAVPYSTAARLASLLALITVALSITAAVAAWRSGMTAARYFIGAWLIFLAGAGLFALNKLGAIPHNAVTENALQLGSLAEVVLLSFALGDRINTERRERFQARLEALRREREAAQLQRFVPPQLIEEIRGGGADALAHTRRDVTVLCATPYGFIESLCRLDLDKVGPVVNGFVAALSELARRHAGVIEQFVGPRLSILFGALGRQPPEQVARAAATMAIELQREANRLLRAWEAEGLQVLRLRIAVGIASGEAVVGAFGMEHRLEFSALGEPLTRAHLLAADAIPGEVRLDRRAAELLEPEFSIGEAPLVEYEPGAPEPSFRLAHEIPLQDPAVAMDETLEHGEASSPSGDPRVIGRSLPLLEVGALFDQRYRIEGELGRGGSGVVYRAQHLALGQARALKLIAPHRLRTAPAAEQFRREAEQTARIHHPNVVAIHDFGRSIEGHYYLAFDLVDGEPLSRVVARRGRLPQAEALAIASAVLDALEAAHAMRLVHRDIKPANILIDGAGGVRVTDFGLVQPLDDAPDERAPPAGTPHYMSPEQCRGIAVDARTDLYALGVTLYQMLTGVFPFPDGSPSSIVRAVIGSPPGPIIAHLPTVPDALRAVIERCLAKDPEDRPSSAAALAAELRELAGTGRVRERA
jgi:class 3 adenylate cyclase